MCDHLFSNFHGKTVTAEMGRIQMSDFTKNTVRFVLSPIVICSNVCEHYGPINILKIIHEAITENLY